MEVQSSVSGILVTYSLIRNHEEYDTHILYHVDLLIGAEDKLVTYAQNLARARGDTMEIQLKKETIVPKGRGTICSNMPSEQAIVMSVKGELERSLDYLWEAAGILYGLPIEVHRVDAK
jgi:hypothetical protein